MQSTQVGISPTFLPNSFRRALSCRCSMRDMASMPGWPRARCQNTRSRIIFCLLIEYVSVVGSGGVVGFCVVSGSGSEADGLVSGGCGAVIGRAVVVVVWS